MPGSSLIPVTAWQLLQEPLQLAVASAAGKTQATNDHGASSADRLLSLGGGRCAGMCEYLHCTGHDYASQAYFTETALKTE